MRYEKYKIRRIYLINEITQRTFSIVSKIQFLVFGKKKKKKKFPLERDPDR